MKRQTRAGMRSDDRTRKPGQPENGIVFDPRGEVRIEHAPTAPRVRQLAGLRLGLLDNSKWNANKILRGAAAALREEIAFTQVNYYVKESFSKDAAPELIDRIANENDIVLTAIGDCGSCTSACLRDAIGLEKRGVPTATVVTTEFVRETELTRRALGMETLRTVVIAHPVSSITKDEVAQRVAQIKQQAQEVWLGIHSHVIPDAEPHTARSASPSAPASAAPKSGPSAAPSAVRSTN